MSIFTSIAEGSAPPSQRCIDGYWVQLKPIPGWRWIRHPSFGDNDDFSGASCAGSLASNGTQCGGCRWRIREYSLASVERRLRQRAYRRGDTPQSA